MVALDPGSTQKPPTGPLLGKAGCQHSEGRRLQRTVGATVPPALKPSNTLEDAHTSALFPIPSWKRLFLVGTALVCQATHSETDSTHFCSARWKDKDLPLQDLPPHSFPWGNRRKQWGWERLGEPNPKSPLTKWDGGWRERAQSWELHLDWMQLGPDSDSQHCIHLHCEAASCPIQPAQTVVGWSLPRLWPSQRSGPSSWSTGSTTFLCTEKICRDSDATQKYSELVTGWHFCSPAEAWALQADSDWLLLFTIFSALHRKPAMVTWYLVNSDNTVACNYPLILFNATLNNFQKMVLWKHFSREMDPRGWGCSWDL